MTSTLSKPGVILAALLLAASPAAPVQAQALATAAEFEYIDSNHDGRVSSGEHEVYARQVFDEMDADPDDDQLTRAEIIANETKFFRHAFAGGTLLAAGGLTAEQKLARIDVNHDGKVSQAEYLNAAAAWFQELDGDDNGELSPLEFDAGG